MKDEDAHFFVEEGIKCKDRKDYREAFRLFKLVADEGHPLGQYALAVLYENVPGSAPPEEVRRVYDLVKTAAETGSKAGQYSFARMYAEGYGVAQNEKEAFKWFQRAAIQGYPTAEFNIGLRYASGRGVTKDVSEAIRWFEQAANHGHIIAQFNLGHRYAVGAGVPQNEVLAVTWLEKAANQGSVKAQLMLAEIYAKNPESEVAALTWFQRAADQGYEPARIKLEKIKIKEHASASMPAIANNQDGYLMARPSCKSAIKKAGELECALALLHMTSTPLLDYSKAYVYLESATQKDNALAYAYFGLLYEYGLGVERSLHAAVFFYSKASKAHAKHPLICILSAVTYLRRLKIDSSQPVERVTRELLTMAKDLSNAYRASDLEEILAFFEDRAEQGSMSALLILVLVYERGLLGATQDRGRAEKIFARLIHSDAEAWTLYNLGLLYTGEYALEQNSKWAKRSFEVAAKKGSIRAWYELGMLYRNGAAGISQNYLQALRYFLLAAEQGGYPLAHLALSTLYAQGLGVEVDEEKARRHAVLSGGRARADISTDWIGLEPLPMKPNVLKKWFASSSSKPLPYIQSEGIDIARVLYDWKAECRADRLPIRSGEIVYILEKKGNWWHCENQKRQEGMVPCNFIEVLPMREPIMDGYDIQLPARALEINKKELGNFSDMELLDVGAYGQVFRWFWPKMGMLVAVKRSLISANSGLSEKDIVNIRESINRELEIMMRLQLHPNVVRLCAYVKPTEVDDFPILVMEYVNGGSLWRHLGGRKDRSVFLPWATRYSIALNIAAGLSYLHSHKIVHCDIKSVNIMLCDYSGTSFFAKLIDLGEAKRYEGTGEFKTVRSKQLVGTLAWTAPELLNSEGCFRYKPEVDIYSFGMVLWELMTHEVPYEQLKESNSSFDLIKHVGVEGKREKIPNSAPSFFKKITQRCWQQDPKDRAKMSEIVETLTEGTIEERNKVEREGALKNADYQPRSTRRTLEVLGSREPEWSDPERASLMRIQIREGDIDAAIEASLESVQKEERIGPREIEGFELEDVKDDGNCFYHALASQLKYTHRERFLVGLPEGTALHDSLRLLVQGEQFQDRKWADIEEIFSFVEKSNSVVAIIDTRALDNGFRCYFTNALGAQQDTSLVCQVPSNRPVVRLAYTGDHYLSVLSHVALDRGAIRGEFSVMVDHGVTFQSNRV